MEKDIMAITDFMSNGAMGTTENLFTNALETMPDATFMELYGTLTPVLARQFVNLPDTPVNPLTQAFISEPIEFGSVIEDIYIEAVAMGATKTDPSELGSAADEFGFADVNMRKQYSTINALNTGKVSRYEHEIKKASLNATIAGSLGEGIIQALRVGQVSCLENQVGKVLVSSIPPENNVYCGVTSEDDGATAIKKERQKIIDVAMDMSKVNGTYTATGYDGTAAREIYIIATKNKWADLILDKSGIFHPEYLEFEMFEKLGVKITPIPVDKIETPLTSSELAEYQEMSGITWKQPEGMGQEKPDYIICDKRYARINPFIDRYMMRATNVNANIPYTNFFLHMQNAISYQPNRKAVRVYAGEAPTPVTHGVNITITPDGSGTGDVKFTAEVGSTVKPNISATEGYTFDHYESSDVEFSDPTDIAGTFTMPDKDVEITALFKSA